MAYFLGSHIEKRVTLVAKLVFVKNHARIAHFYSLTYAPVCLPSFALASVAGLGLSGPGYAPGRRTD
ncbi:hypothetical protein GCM10028803_28760 [Larkinella knui]